MYDKALFIATLMATHFDSEQYKLLLRVFPSFHSGTSLLG